MARKKTTFKLTKSQKEAIKTIKKFVDDDSIPTSEWFTLDGKAGVGKTTVLIDVIKHYSDKKHVCVAAIAHKAKNVLRDKFYAVDKVSKFKVQFCSIASMLGMKFDEQTGEFTYAKYNESFFRPIDTADLIIIDECSMVDAEALHIIMQEKRLEAKVIFSGDLGQLPPVSDGTKASPTFDTKHTYKLTERLRQGEESPILPYSDLYWNSVMENVDYVIRGEKNSIIDNNGGIYFGNRANVLNMCVNTFKKAIEKGDLNLIKYVCYRNNTRSQLNNYIRKSIFGEDLKEYNVSDFVILMDNYEDPRDKDYIIENSTEFVVTDVKERVDEIDGTEIKVFELYGDKLYSRIDVVAEESKLRFNNLVSKRFQAAKDEKVALKKKNLFAKAYELKRKYADVDFSYAITSHKSQGSTYNCVIVDEPDIMSVTMTNIITKYRSMYTAITRASKLCVIVS